MKDIKKKDKMRFKSADIYARQIWCPNLSWVNYHEFGIVVQKDYSVEVEGGAKLGSRIPIRREWLIDWSSRLSQENYKKKTKN
jgi:hypothetical protein